MIKGEVALKEKDRKYDISMRGHVYGYRVSATGSFTDSQSF